jgi:transposase-like protein
VCCRAYTPEPLPLGYDTDTKEMALKLYLEGNGFRRIGRLLGVNHQSVVNRVNAAHAALPGPSASASPPETLQMDELFTFVGSKKRKLMSSQS